MSATAVRPQPVLAVERFVLALMTWRPSRRSLVLRSARASVDELIRSSRARNVFADLEDADEEELDAFQLEFEQLRKRGMRTTEAALAAKRHASKAKPRSPRDDRGS